MSQQKRARKVDKQQEVAEAIAAYLIEHGLADSGIRALAKAAGVSDRMLMYYFGNKEAAITAALTYIGQALGARLNAVIPENHMTAEQLLEDLLTASSSDEFYPVIRLWFELVGLAVRGETPYQESVREMASNWQLWIEAKLKPEEAHQAEKVFAQLEGQLMINLIRG